MKNAKITDKSIQSCIDFLRHYKQGTDIRIPQLQAEIFNARGHTYSRTTIANALSYLVDENEVHRIHGRLYRMGPNPKETPAVGREIVLNRGITPETAITYAKAIGDSAAVLVGMLEHRSICPKTALMGAREIGDAAAALIISLKETASAAEEAISEVSK